jgi:hypothetical protein
MTKVEQSLETMKKPPGALLQVAKVQGGNTPKGVLSSGAKGGTRTTAQKSM